MRCLSILTVLILLNSLPGGTEAACQIAATSINFGKYDVFDTTAVNGMGSVTVSCDEAPPPDVTISISESLHSGQFDPRQMKNLADGSRLNYNIYTDQSKSKIWGNGSGATSPLFIKNVTKNKSKTTEVYGSMSPGQNGSAGFYSDVLTITILW